MTVNTNHVNVHPPMNPQMDHSNCCAPCERMLQEVRDSQLRTEAMVNDFIQNMSKNPMLKMMAGRFGG